ncbi:MAG: family 43 glycosylhydrolase [Butyrivibrio sp.]|nr:family 43 glycosylhydrolase [Butyrivibrio sp.]
MRFRKIKHSKTYVLMAMLTIGCLTGCGSHKNLQKAETGDDSKMYKTIIPLNSYKKNDEHNPVMTYRFGADPYALVYNGRVYLYMTGDKVSYEPDGTIKENTYSNINTINVISSEDLVNWTDHGTIYAAGINGAASWGKNSWAPAAAYKKIDGKDKFFLYFANNGNGIAVLTADSPIGPFTDPIGGPIISRDTPTCNEVTWLFDPAVLMDDDGSCYIYFGGGVPSPDKASNPGTARVAKLSEDMISLEKDPVAIENVSYLFEDSGINKIGNTYYYSYCTNFDVTKEAEKEHGFSKGEIMTMKSDSPMGPFEPCNPVLKNPENFFGKGGNNHHCMFEFEGQWYIAYHSRILETAMDMDGGYRSTNIDKLVINEELEPDTSIGTKEGVMQTKGFDPYREIPAVTMCSQAGISTKQFGEVSKKYGSGDMVLSGLCDGAWTSINQVDFGKEGASGLKVKVTGDGFGTISLCLDDVHSVPFCTIDVDTRGNREEEISAVLDEFTSKITGIHTVYFLFGGSDYQVYSWEFIR